MASYSNHVKNVQKRSKKLLTWVWTLCDSGGTHGKNTNYKHMRTKALLCAAALAAGTVASMAQSNVYSLNIVGYVNVPLKAGFNLIANPLDNGTNTLSSLFPNAGFGDTVYQFNNGTFASSLYAGAWSPDLVTVPGGGIFYQAGSAFTNTFVGNVLTGSLTNKIKAGFNIVSSQVPQADTLENLGYPAGFGDTAYFFRNGAYVSSLFAGAWSPDLVPAVGEAFWMQAGAAVDWTRSFNP